MDGHWSPTAGMSRTCRRPWWQHTATSRRMTGFLTTVCARQVPTLGAARMLLKQKTSPFRTIVIICLHMFVKPFDQCTSASRKKNCSKGASAAWPKTIMNACILIWALAPKEQHASLFAVEAAVAEAVMKFNSGNARTSSAILQELHLSSGLLNSQRMAEKDDRRASARKRASAENLQRTFKKRHSGSCRQTDYIPGGYWSLS